MTSPDRDFGVNEGTGASRGFRRRDELAERRKAIGWTQQNLGAALDVAAKTVSRWERGETTPPAWVRDSLAQKLQLSVVELADLIKRRTPLRSVVNGDCRRKRRGLQRKRRISRRK